MSKKSFSYLNKDYLSYVDNLLKKKPKKSEHKATPQKVLKQKNQRLSEKNDNVYHKFMNYEFIG